MSIVISKANQVPRTTSKVALKPVTTLCPRIDSKTQKRMLQEYREGYGMVSEALRIVALPWAKQYSLQAVYNVLREHYH